MLTLAQGTTKWYFAGVRVAAEERNARTSECLARKPVMVKNTVLVARAMGALRANLKTCQMEVRTLYLASRPRRYQAIHTGSNVPPRPFLIIRL